MLIYFFIGLPLYFYKKYPPQSIKVSIVIIYKMSATQVLTCSAAAAPNYTSLIASLCVATAVLDCDASGNASGVGLEIINSLFYIDPSGATGESGAYYRDSACWQNILISFFDTCDCDISSNFFKPQERGCYKQSYINAVLDPSGDLLDATSTFKEVAIAIIDAIIYNDGDPLLDLPEAPTLENLVKLINALVEILLQFNRIKAILAKVPLVCPV
jgi:hypothetical protein